MLVHHHAKRFRTGSCIGLPRRWAAMKFGGLWSLHFFLRVSAMLGIDSCLLERNQQEDQVLISFNGHARFRGRYVDYLFVTPLSSGVFIGVVWQVSFLNKICWIWSSSVVTNTLKFSWMKRTCDVWKVFSQIESLQVDIKSLKYRKESFFSKYINDITNSNFLWMKTETVSYHISGNNVDDWASDRFPVRNTRIFNRRFLN